METENKELNKINHRFSITVTIDDLQIENELENIALPDNPSESLSAHYKPSGPNVSVGSSHMKIKSNPLEISKFIRSTGCTEQLLTGTSRKIPKLNRSAVFASDSKPSIKSEKNKGKKITCSAACIIV